MNEEVQRDNLKPYMLWLLLLTFLAPIGAAYWLYSVGGSEHTVNKGEFVPPGIQILDMGLTTLDGQPVTEKALYGHWHMMFYMGSDCDKQCEEKIYTLRQIKTSFHKDSERMTNILVHFDKNINPAFSERINEYYANFDRYYADKEAFSRILGFSGEELIQKRIVYIVDPIGNVILRYNADSAPQDIISDMKRLLKASQIG